MKKSVIAIIILMAAFVIFLSGCETAKGAAKGASEGAQKDWQSLQGVDAKTRDVLW